MSAATKSNTRNAGYYSWVCFEDAQKGAWFGPVSFNEVHVYESGFTKDPNIKSFTFFQSYDDTPQEPLSCDFANRAEKLETGFALSTTFSECERRSRGSDYTAESGERGAPRLLLYNLTDLNLEANCFVSGLGDRKPIPFKPKWAQWRLATDTDYSVKIFQGGSDRVLFRGSFCSDNSDTHWMVFEDNKGGLFARVGEPW